MAVKKGKIEVVAELIIKVVLVVNPIWIRLVNLEKNKEVAIWGKDFLAKTINMSCSLYHKCSRYGSENGAGGRMSCVRCSYFEKGIDKEAIKAYNNIILKTGDQIDKSQDVTFCNYNNDCSLIQELTKYGENIEAVISEINLEKMSKPVKFDFVPARVRRNKPGKRQKEIKYKLVFDDKKFEPEIFVRMTREEAEKTAQEWCNVLKNRALLFRIVDEVQEKSSIKEVKYLRINDNDSPVKVLLTKEGTKGSSWKILLDNGNGFILKKQNAANVCEALRVLRQKNNQKNIKLIRIYAKEFTVFDWEDYASKGISQRPFDQEVVDDIVEQLGYKSPKKILKNKTNKELIYFFSI